MNKKDKERIVWLEKENALLKYHLATISHLCNYPNLEIKQDLKIEEGLIKKEETLSVKCRRCHQSYQNTSSLKKTDNYDSLVSLIKSDLNLEVPRGIVLLDLCNNCFELLTKTLNSFYQQAKQIAEKRAKKRIIKISGVNFDLEKLNIDDILIVWMKF